MVVKHGDEQEQEIVSLVKKVNESRGLGNVVTDGPIVRTGDEPLVKYSGMVWYDKITYNSPVFRLWDGSNWVNLAQKLVSRTTLLAIDTPIVI